MENPIKKSREQLGLSVKELGMMSSTVEVTVRTNENGENVKITKKILNFLVDQGFDKEQLERDYEKYRQWKVSQISQKIKKSQ